MLKRGSRPMFLLFLEFPAEIRLMVYGYLDLAYDRRVPVCAPPPITRVNRLIRAETLPIFFSNTFEVGYEGVNEPSEWAGREICFMHAAGHTSRSLLRKFFFAVGGHTAGREDEIKVGLSARIQINNDGETSIKVHSLNMRNWKLNSKFLFKEFLRWGRCGIWGFKVKWPMVDNQVPEVDLLDMMREFQPMLGQIHSEITDKDSAVVNEKSGHHWFEATVACERGNTRFPKQITAKFDGDEVELEDALCLDTDDESELDDDDASGEDDESGEDLSELGDISLFEELD
jgi:hypothetical protein